MEEFIGAVKIFGFNFAPRGWSFCDGQIMSIAQNTALFSLLGTTYGGNGQTTFALPDLRGRSAVHPGTGPGLPNIQHGEVGGSPTVALLTSNLPAHNHALNFNNATGTQVATSGAVIATGPSSGSGPNASVLKSYTAPFPATAPNTPLHAQTVGSTGSNIPVAIRNPYLGIYHAICLEGIFPSRN